MASSQATGSQIKSGIVKQVLSGDTLVIRGQPRGGPPPEKTVTLSNITAPRLARRPNPITDTAETKDEPYAWDCREYLRKLVIGKEVTFFVEHGGASKSSSVTGSGRLFGYVWVKKDEENINIAEQLVQEGLAEVRTTTKPSQELTQLKELEEQAKASEKGKWSKEKKLNAVRNVIWNVEKLDQFVDRSHGKEFDAIIEHVRDGCTVRALLLPDFINVTLMMSGIKCPMFKKNDSGKEVPEQYAEQAKFFTESRLLQRDVKIILEGVSNQNVLGTIIHPAGSITELLLKEGFAKCVDWSIAIVTQGKEKLRSAERFAKENQTRIWKDYLPLQAKQQIPAIKTKEFTAKVMEVVNGDALIVKGTDGAYQKIFFSSLKAPSKPKTEDAQEASAVPNQKFRPLYDVPHMYEAREFLRKKLIGKKVNVIVDYIRPASDDFPERTSCTVVREGINIAEALISKGLATVIRHRADDDQRSVHYDELFAAEKRAIKNNKGLHSKKEYPMHRVAEISGDVAKAKQFLPFLKRSGRTAAIVEFVASGSRLRLYLPKDTCLITFLLAGVTTPRAASTNPKSGQALSDEKYGQEALQFTKDIVMQREVEVEVESMDKGGNFVGWLYIEGKNLSLLLIQEGLSKVHFTADRTHYASALYEAEEQAKIAKKKLWEDYTEGQDDEQEDESEVAEEINVERIVDYKEVVVTEIRSGNHFYAQLVEQGQQLETLMNEMRQELSENPPLVGSFVPKRGLKCLAQFSDGLWYRAVVESVVSRSEVQVLYSDYGNHDTIPFSKTAALPAKYSSLPPQATEYYLACALVPDDDDWAKDALKAFRNEALNQTLLLNVEYKVQSQLYVSLTTVGANKKDITGELLEDGLLRVENTRRCSPLLVAEYKKSEEKARKGRVNIWCYGDFTPDDAKEFGYKKL